MTTETHPKIVSVNLTPAMSGFFATIYGWNPEGYYEPYETGYGRYATWEEANREGAQIAAEMGVEFQPATAERAAAAEIAVAASRVRIGLILAARKGQSAAAIYQRAH